MAERGGRVKSAEINARFVAYRDALKLPKALTVHSARHSSILARTLGIHTDVAVAWQRLSAGDWATYAAEVSTRETTTKEFS
ncbi:hypothetical protein [Streptomyces sp. NPDC059783]|uniref:hypothetical protein n=1 Tax=Streptomyces sp. NPDC059783 TaxID=3346944 RepID=UPI003657A9DC